MEERRALITIVSNKNGQIEKRKRLSTAITNNNKIQVELKENESQLPSLVVVKTFKERGTTKL
jgi:hypothetical protein